MGIEPATDHLRSDCSTTELHRLVAFDDLIDLLSTMGIINLNLTHVKRFLADCVYEKVVGRDRQRGKK